MNRNKTKKATRLKVFQNPIKKIGFWLSENFRAESIEFYRLAGLTGFLVLFGVVMVLSSSSIDSLVANRDAYYVASRQGAYALIGLIGMTVVASIPVSFFRSKVIFILAGALVLQSLVPFIGINVNGNTNWIAILGFTLQPSEFLKLALIIYMGSIISEREEFLSRSRSVIWPVFAVGGIALFLVMLGGDLGTSVIILIILFGTLLVAGAPITPLLKILGGMAILVVIAVVVTPSRVTRITAWLNPDSVISEALNWQYEHGTWALAAGGIFGVGLGNSKMKWSWIPEVENDFIFAVIGEELGLVGAFVVIGLFSLLIWTLIKIMLKSEDGFARFTILGIVLWIMGQSFVNLAVVLGLLPVLGVPLPFISAGGSSLIATLGAIGLVLAFEKQSHRQSQVRLRR
jgi:cell division protein FtsW